jgi:diguanylate cyclase (GGDEF)-like protein
LSLALLFGVLSLARAADILHLIDSEQTYSVGRHLSYLEDKTGTLTLKNVLTDNDRLRFVDSEVETPNFSFTNSVYWFRLELSNRNSRVSEWLLESQYPLLDHIDAHLVYPNNRIVSFESGDLLPFSQRAIKHRNVTFLLSLEKGERVTVFIRVKSESSMQLPLKLWSTRSLLAKDHEEQYVLGIYYGILIAMFLYNLLLFLSSRDINYLYYVYYIGGWIMFQMSLNGLAFEYLWPNSPAWGNIATPFFIGCGLGGVVQFTRSFLQLNRNLPTFDLILRVYFWLLIVVAAASFLVAYSIVIKVVTFAALTGSAVIFAAALRCLKKSVRQAKYFVLAWSALLLGMVIYPLKTFGILPNNFMTEYGMQIGSTLEVVLLSFALAHRMRLLKEDNERIQREATETLEQNVEQRTSELDKALRSLSAANNKLKALSHTDGLTGVKNRAYFDERFDLEWRRAHRGRYAIGLLMLDIDHFKNVNDTFGHPGGDECLRQVARTLEVAINRPGDDVFRYGGEEFVVILSNTDADGAAHIGEIIRHKVEALKIEFEGRKIPVTVSIGASSMIPELGGGGSMLIRNADKALYQAKRDGRNRVCTFENPEPASGKRSDT